MKGRIELPKALSISTLLAIAGVALYWPVLSFPFIPLDDPDYVTENPIVQQGLTWSGLRWAATTFHASNWHPLTWLSHMIDCELFGLSPRGHHFTNLLLHIASSVLLFHLVRMLSGAPWRSGFVAAVFLLHPLHVESVAWVAERKDVLSGFFFILALVAYARYARHPRWQSYVVVLACFGAGLLSKPMLVTFPFVLLLLDIWPLRRWNGPSPKTGSSGDRCFPKAGPAHLFLEKVPMLGMSAASSVVTFLAQKAGGAVAAMDSLPLSARFGNALTAYAAYLRKMFWPADFSIFYPYAQPSAVSIVVAVAVLAAITALALRLRRQFPAVLIGWLWFLGMLVPVIGLVQVGEQSMADRYMYLPMIGLLIAATWPAAEFRARIKIQWLMPAIGGVVLVALSVITASYLRVWNTNETLFRHAISATEGNHVALSSLGVVYLEEGRLDEAEEKFSQAAGLKRGYFPALFGLAKVLEIKGEPGKAEGMLRTALSARPESAPAHYNLAVVLAELGRSEEAVQHYREAVRLDPVHGRAHNNLSNLLLARGDVHGAVAHAESALRLLPGSAEAHLNLGNAYFVMERFADAESHYRSALQTNAKAAAARLNLSKVLLLTNRAKESEKELRMLLAQEPENLEAHQVLISQLLSNTRFAEAIIEYRRVIQTLGERAEWLNNLAWLLATAPDPNLRSGNEAVPLAKRACELTRWENPSMLSTLAAAYAESGQFPEAIKVQEKARQLTAELGGNEQTARAVERLRLYQEGRKLTGK